MKRSAAASVLVAVMLTASPASADEQPLIESVDLSDLPSISMVLALPGEVAAESLSAEDFAVVVGDSRPEIDVFARVRDPLHVVVVIDTSGSMAGEPIAAAREAAAAFVAALPQNTVVSLVSFGDTVDVLATTGQDAASAVAELEAAGETSLYDAAVTASSLFEATSTARRAVVILSDGGDTVSSASLEEAASALARAGADVRAIALTTSESDLAALEKLAPGSVRTVGDTAGLTAEYSRFASELTGRYRISFQADGTGTTEIRLLVNTSGGVLIDTTTVDLPTVAATVSTSPESDATPPAATPVTPAVVTPGPLAGRWTLGAGTALVFAGAALGLAITTRRRHSIAPAVIGEKAASTSKPLPIVGRLFKLGDRAIDEGRVSGVDTALDRAGVALRPGEFIVLAATGAVAATLAGLALAGLPGAVILGGAAAAAPRFLLRLLTERRRLAFADQLEGTLQIIAGSLRAGYGLMQAISTVAAESPSPTDVEFNRVVVENRLGRTVEQSMAAMAERMQNEDLGWVVEAIEIQHEVGGDLAEVLDTVTTTIRDRNMVRRQVKALSAEGRISAFILLGLPFVIAGFIAMVSPDYLAELTGSTLGRIMLGVAAMLMVAGGAWIRRLIRVEF